MYMERRMGNEGMRLALLAGGLMLFGGMAFGDEKTGIETSDSCSFSERAPALVTLNS
jgi:hypothetical protein